MPDVVEGFLTIFGNSLKRTMREVVEPILVNCMAQRVADEQVNQNAETVAMPEFSHTS